MALVGYANCQNIIGIQQSYGFNGKRVERKCPYIIKARYDA
jgi:hypothetical protein